MALGQALFAMFQRMQTSHGVIMVPLFGGLVCAQIGGTGGQLNYVSNYDNQGNQ